MIMIMIIFTPRFRTVCHGSPSLDSFQFQRMAPGPNKDSKEPEEVKQDNLKTRSNPGQLDQVDQVGQVGQVDQVGECVKASDLITPTGANQLTDAKDSKKAFIMCHLNSSDQICPANQVFSCILEEL